MKTKLKGSQKAAAEKAAEKAATETPEVVTEGATEGAPAAAPKLVAETVPEGSKWVKASTYPDFAAADNARNALVTKLGKGNVKVRLRPAGYTVHTRK